MSKNICRYTVVALGTAAMGHYLVAEAFAAAKLESTDVPAPPIGALFASVTSTDTGVVGTAFNHVTDTEIVNFDPEETFRPPYIVKT